MDYEQKYHEALERAKTLFESQESSPGRKKWLSDVFPELRESEDEKTRISWTKIPNTASSLIPKSRKSRTGIKSPVSLAKNMKKATSKDTLKDAQLAIIRR